jgi:hypothetical protein
MTRKKRVALFWLWWLQCCHGDVVLNCVFLMDMNTFTSKGASRASELEQILETSFSKPGGVTLQSIQSDSMTGAEVKQLYFPQNTDIRLFSIVHLTRITVALQTDNDANTTKYVSAHLPSLCAHIAPVAIDSVGAPMQSVYNFFQQFPPALGFVMICLWLITMASCGVCWLCVLYHCGRKKKKKEVIPPPAPDPPAPPIQHLIEAMPSAPPLFLVRLPEGLESEDQYDPYAALTTTTYGGPAAVRLESWPADPDPPPH